MVQQDTFGLRTADAAGKNAFETFDGDHIRFTEAELEKWLDAYFTAQVADGSAPRRRRAGAHRLYQRV